MQRNGYRIIPVNPFERTVLGEKCYPDLDNIPERVDIVDIFRRAEFVPGIVEAAIRIGARAVWMQEGVVHQEAAAKAAAAGLAVVMDRCILKDHASMRRPAIGFKLQLCLARYHSLTVVAQCGGRPSFRLNTVPPAKWSDPATTPPAASPHSVPSLAWMSADG